ncbi:gp3 [Brochothrix phage A9]|uniref:Gp3 n=1 Tax=Brochothrix phage A9 TaxID=857312 RepID=D9J0F0_9CAUD|nr:gp3 [Brochothrix phage A9]ADJ53045.1 gp3 [Brochothrix phage A9]
MIFTIILILTAVTVFIVLWRAERDILYGVMLSFMFTLLLSGFCLVASILTLGPGVTQVPTKHNLVQRNGEYVERKLVSETDMVKFTVKGKGEYVEEADKATIKGTTGKPYVTHYGKTVYKDNLWNNYFVWRLPVTQEDEHYTIYLPFEGGDNK